ncbi:MAG: hypothetical protein WC264_03660 [Candidatus Paceibacterota bacterium]|jgi:hypothetical protein
MEITLEEIQKKFESLPEDLRWAIMAVNVDEKITEIGKENNLTVEQMGQLSLETHMVMFGFVHPDKFEASVKGSLQLPDDKNKKIVNEVNEKILKEIREKLMSLYGKQEEKKDDEILNNAGIEITTPNPLLEKEGGQASPPYGGGDGRSGDSRDEMIKKIEDPELIAKEMQNKKIMQSISAQKLSGSFQIPNTKTEYSLNNMSKTSKTPEGPKDIGVKVPLGATIKPTSGATASTSPSFSVKVDPYREMPE